jgi:L-cysteine S-thiosulfotransferase
MPARNRPPLPNLFLPHTPLRGRYAFALAILVLLIATFLTMPLAAQTPSQTNTASDAEQGFRIMATGNLGNCLACHALPGQTDVRSTFGPALGQVASRYNASTLRQWVTDARQIKPDTLMPPFGSTAGTNAAVRSQPMLTEEQIAHVVAALLTLQ